jgi:hypothetical protein
MSEALEFKGWLIEQEEKARTLRLRMDGLRSAVRLNLSELVPVDALNCEAAAAQAVELCSLQIDLKELLALIAEKKNRFGLR